MKGEILALLHSGDDGWTAQDWRAFYDERAGIAEYDGALERPKAEGAPSIVSSSGSPATLRAPLQIGVAHAEGASAGARFCCPSALRLSDMLGFTRSVGLNGMSAADRKQSPRFRDCFRSDSGCANGERCRAGGMISAVGCPSAGSRACRLRPSIIASTMVVPKQSARARPILRVWRTVSVQEALVVPTGLPRCIWPAGDRNDRCT